MKHDDGCPAGEGASPAADGTVGAPGASERAAAEVADLLAAGSAR